jgi:hypothetical protein
MLSMHYLFCFLSMIICLSTFTTLTLGLLVSYITQRPRLVVVREDAEMKTLYQNTSVLNERNSLGSNAVFNHYNHDIWKMDDKFFSFTSGVTSEKSRRYILQRLTIATFLSLVPLDLAQAVAISPEEVIRQGASQLPGYGQPDVYYPHTFSGVWRVTRTSERGSYQTAVRPSSIQSVDWDTKNPNVLHVTFSNGTWKEVKVTKRSYQAGTTSDGMKTFTASELRRITYTDYPDVNSIPTIQGSRLMTKWKWDENSGLSTVNVIEGIELLIPTGESGDPLTSPGTNTISRLASSKCYLYMERIQ